MAKAGIRMGKGTPNSMAPVNSKLLGRDLSAQKTEIVLVCAFFVAEDLLLPIWEEPHCCNEVAPASPHNAAQSEN